MKSPTTIAVLTIRERLWRVGEIRQREEFIGLDQGQDLEGERRLTVDRGATKVQEGATLFKNFPVVTLIDATRGQPTVRSSPSVSAAVHSRESPIATTFNPSPHSTVTGNPSSAETCRVKARPASSRSKTASSVLKSTL